MYIEAYQMLNNEPFQPDTSITQVQLKTQFLKISISSLMIYTLNIKFIKNN